MWSPKAKVIATISCLGVLGAMGIAVAQGPGAPQSAPAAEVREVHGGGWFGWHRGGRHGGPGFARLCDAEARAEWIEARLDLVESFAEFNPEQAAAWTTLTDAVRTASGRVDEACTRLQAEGRPDTAPERLARAEAMMTTGLTVVQDVRAPFEAFYGTLGAEQQAAVDRMLQHGRRGRG